MDLLLYIWAIAFSAHEFHPFVVIVFPTVLVVVLFDSFNLSKPYI